MASGPATTSSMARTGERSDVPMVAAQRLGTAADRAWQQSYETDAAEKEEERREQMDPVGQGVDLVQFEVGNRANNRRKAGDRAEKANYSYNIDGEKSHVPSLKNLPPIIHHDAFVSNAQNDYSHARLVPLEGCSASEASQLLSERWAAAMNMYNDPNDSPDKPVMYAGSGGSSWGQGHMKLPHQFFEIC
ncbi:hypothetical protein TRIUR3_23456 [Triticum urartu]|uniref:Uncharacterized protein n=1 Tax=Triticum urartu TaxID=4572 RepID=M7Z985_TRIUA|nr:hypothetical protein TRIUR3_23456 [Triticum urartu]